MKLRTKKAWTKRGRLLVPESEPILQHKGKKYYRKRQTYYVSTSGRVMRTGNELHLSEC